MQGLQRQFSAINVLQSVETFFHSSGASCKATVSSFTVDVRFIPIDRFSCLLYFYLILLCAHVEHDLILLGHCIKRSLWCNRKEQGTNCWWSLQLSIYEKDVHWFKFFATFFKWPVFPHFGRLTSFLGMNRMPLVVKLIFYGFIYFSYRSFSKSQAHFWWEQHCSKEMVQSQVLTILFFSFCSNYIFLPILFINALVTVL